MTKLILFISLLFITAGLKAQSEHSLTVGAGGGAVTTYAGAAVIKTTAAFYGNAAYYPSEYFDISLEAQIGTLSGGNPHTRHLNFVNKYQAGFAEVHEHLGGLFQDADNFFADFLSNTYVGAGFGLIHNNVTQINFSIDHFRNITPVIPIKVGYLWTIKDKQNDEIIKVNFSYGANPTIGRGIDGYFGSMPQKEKFYVFYAIGLEYTFDLTGNYPGRKMSF
jgi:hypothetical protein